MAAQIEAARWLVYYGAWRVDQNTLDPATAARVKLVASETPVVVSEQAIRIHRDALVYVIGEGASEVQKNIIARDLGFEA